MDFSLNETQRGYVAEARLVAEQIAQDTNSVKSIE